MKSATAARSWIGFYRTNVSVLYKKEDVIEDLEIPDDVLDLLFSVEMETLVQLKPSHEPRFKKNVTEGVIGGLSVPAGPRLAV